MKKLTKLISIIICLAVLAVCLNGCNFPQLGKKAAPTEVPAEAPAASEEPAEEAPVTDEKVPVEEEEEQLITNPSHSSLFNGTMNSGAPMIQTASMATGSFSLIRNAQIVKPTASSGDDITIRNDHTIVYQENPPVIQNSVPTGNLQPLTYIPPTQLGSGQAIQFAPGATSAVISGYVQAGGTVSYNLYAFANQNFLVLLTSDSGTSVLSVSDIYGNIFLDAGRRQTSHNMYLPRTATYYVNIHSTGYAENFTLQVFIPARVTIPAGKTAAVMAGTVSPYSVVSYTAYMYAGQTARIDDYSGARPTSFLRVSGLQTGVTYMDYTSYSPSWYSVVPVTQDYLIEVISMDQSSNYRLTVDVR